jgi:hypothetical protein
MDCSPSRLSSWVDFAGKSARATQALPVSERFPLFIIKIRLLFASFCMYNPARLVSRSY